MSLSKLDANQVIRSVYDDATQELRVKATLNPGGSSEVIIDHADDSIRLGDGTNLTTVTDVGGKKGLDVNVINEHEVSIQHTEDSISIGDGVDILAINSDGSIIVVEPNWKTHIEDLGTVIYYGFNQNLSASDTDSTWRIYRTTLSGSDTLKEYASNSAGFSFQWTNRTSYFGPIPFTNTYSTILDGQNDYILVPHSSTLNFPRLQEFSFSGWFKTQTPTTAGTLAAKFTGGYGYEIDHDTSGRITINFQGGGTGNRIRVREDTVTIADGNWHFVCVTYDGSGTAAGMRLYVDNLETGRNVLNDTLSVDPVSLANLVIGSNSSGGTPRFQGFIDEVAFWNVELSSGSRTQIYSDSANTNLIIDSGTYNQSSSLISWWRMGDALGYPNIPDQKNGNSGLLTNGVPGSFVTEIP